MPGRRKAATAATKPEEYLAERPQKRSVAGEIPHFVRNDSATQRAEVSQPSLPTSALLVVIFFD